MYLNSLISILVLTTLTLTLTLVEGQNGTASSQNLTTPQICERDNYPHETHTVITQDGYILTLHRITGSPLLPEPATEPKKVVLLQHGLLASSSIWLINKPDSRLGYLLADRGYDVWLGNARGNMYSRNHTTLSPDDAAFWNFSFHESGIYDLPAVIDHILNVTGQSQLDYIGHSMGTTMFWVMGSLRPEYNQKINKMIALAPVAFTQYMGSPLRVVAALILPGLTTGLVANLTTSGKGEYSPNGNMQQQFKQWACNNYLADWALCTIPNFIQYGFDFPQVNISMVPDQVGHFPQGSSIYCVLHQAQGVNSGRFAQFDYGLAKNLIMYKSAIPPDYPLDKITAPVYLIYGHNDWFADPTDVNTLRTQLGAGTLKLYMEVGYNAWNHGDFVSANDVNIYLHPIIYPILNDGE